MIAEIIIQPDGNVKCLHTDVIPLRELGRLTVKRASNVEFSHRHQRWEVVVVRKGLKQRLYASESRESCLQWERDNWEVFV